MNETAVEQALDGLDVREAGTAAALELVIGLLQATHRPALDAALERLETWLAANAPAKGEQPTEAWQVRQRVAGILRAADEGALPGGEFDP